ncbi:hypothetical protein PAGU2595_015170 [Lysobacter xanthus]
MRQPSNRPPPGQGITGSSRGFGEPVTQRPHARFSWARRASLAAGGASRYPTRRPAPGAVYPENDPECLP